MGRRSGKSIAESVTRTIFCVIILSLRSFLGFLTFAHFTSRVDYLQISIGVILVLMTRPIQEINLNLGSVVLPGLLSLPKSMKGFVIFAHGAGSSRFSIRNNFVADFFFENGLGSLLFDLLSEEEDQVYENRFNIEILVERLEFVTRYLIDNKLIPENTKIGFFGASTGAAAALGVAIKLGKKVSAVVSRGGRPDLTIGDFSKLTAPTLLIVGGDDFGVIELNEDTLKKIPSTKELKIIPGATHLFEEPGTLEQAAQAACDWFIKFFT